MANPIVLNADVDMAQRIAGVPKDVREAIARAVIGSQSTKEHWPYYSRIRFQAAAETADGVTTYTLTAGMRPIGFSYAVGQDMQVAGFPAGRLATLADTNLIRERSTEDGATVLVKGISISLMPYSEPVLAAAISNESFVSFEQNGGDNRYKIGKLDMLPQGGGMFGRGVSWIANPSLPDSNSHDVGFVTNGNPLSGSYMPLPQPLAWTPIGQTDSSLVMPVELFQDLQFTATARAAGGVPATDNTAAFDPPDGIGDPGTYVDLMLMLHVESLAARGVNR